MRNYLAVLVFATVVMAGAASLVAADTATGGHAGGVKTLRGELVDTGCYLGHEARGEKHVGCATKCIAGGMPMGLLTADGTLYLITMNHDNPDPYNALKEMAGKTLDLTGVVMARGGMKGIDVTGFKAVAARGR